MSRSSSNFKRLAIQLVVLALASLIAGSAFAKTTKVDCTKNGKLQAAIDSASSGDTIEITGICMENILIRDKALTLQGAASGGPHGITGVTANTDAVRIESSRDTNFNNLVISHPLLSAVRILYHSTVEMTDCSISDSGSANPDLPGGATAIWVQSGSFFNGTRLTLEDNLRGLGAAQQSRAFCYECDFNGNARAASAVQNSVVSLLDSAVTGPRGIDASEQSYIDIDCVSHVSTHACSLDATATPPRIAGQANWQSTVVFYDAGDFHGRVNAFDRSRVTLYGARQMSLVGNNNIGDESSLVVSEGETGNSRLMGTTNVDSFSHAQIYSANTVLDGSLNCGSGGDAWVEGSVDLTDYTFNDCNHAP